MSRNGARYEQEKPDANGLFANTDEETNPADTDEEANAADTDAPLLFGERIDELQYRGLVMIQSRSAFRFGTDSVLLTHFALSELKKAKKGSRVIDLGAGSGALSLLIAAKTGLDVTAVEIDPNQCERLQRTLELNGLSGGAANEAANGAANESAAKKAGEAGKKDARGIGNIEIVCADYLDLGSEMRQSFDHAVCNPPYFKSGSGGEPKHAGATHEGCADIFSVAKAARGLLKFGGSISLCFPAARLAEALTALSVNALEPKKLRLVRTKAGKKPYLALIRAKYGAKPGLTIEDELVLLDENGRYTPEAESYYNGE